MVSMHMLSMAEPFEVWGSGFKPGEPVVIQLRIDETLSPIIGGGRGAQTSANAGGAFAMSFDFISQDPDTQSRAGGMATVFAQGSDGSRASAPVMIIDAPAGVTTPSSSLAANPVEPNESTTIWGAGFMPGEFVSVLAVGASAGADRIVAGGEANDSGAFSVEATINLEVGVYTLMAVGSGGSEATAPLLVATKE